MFATLHPDEYYRSFVHRGVRPDGRSLHRVRKTAVGVGAVGTADGSASAKMGATSVMAGVKASLNAEPALSVDGPPCRVGIHVELGGVALGDKNEDASRVEAFLASALAAGDVLDAEALCEHGTGWVLAVDVYVLNHDGNLYDVCLLAVVGALQAVRLPAIRAVTEDGEEDAVGGPGAVYEIDAARPSRQLTLGSLPVSLTMGLLDDRVIVDPTRDEEDRMATLVTVGMLPTGRMFAFETRGGGASLPPATRATCIKLAEARIEQVVGLFV